MYKMAAIGNQGYHNSKHAKGGKRDSISSTTCVYFDLSSYYSFISVNTCIPVIRINDELKVSEIIQLKKNEPSILIEI